MSDDQQGQASTHHTDMTDESSTSRLYTIGSALAELQRSFPDVSHSSLRFLEREGLLEPVRTEGKHRRYRASDLERVRTIKEWQAQNLSLEEIRHRLAFKDRMAPPGDLSARFLTLAIAGRIDEAASVILNADEAGVPLLVTFQEILSPALIALGDKWASGEVTVGQEHEVSELCRDLIADLTSRHMGQLRGDLTVLAACVEGELHELGLRMVYGLLRQRGVLVHFLGANVPSTFLVESILMRQPDLVLLSVALESHRESLMWVASAIHRSVPPSFRPRIIIGGQLDGLAGNDLGEDILMLNAGSLGEAIETILSA